MKRRDVVDLYNMLESFSTRDDLSRKFAYFVARNKRTLKDEVESIQSSIKPNPGMVEYDRKRIEILRKYAKKDDQGNPIINNNQFDIPNDVYLEFKEEMQKILDEEYIKEALKIHKENEDSLNELLDEEIELVGIVKTYIEELPDKIKPEEVDVMLRCEVLIEE